MELLNAKLVPGDSITVKAIVQPVKGTLPFVTFESTSPAVVSANEIGMVVAKQPGDARIIACSVQNESIYSFITITVSASTANFSGSKTFGESETETGSENDNAKDENDQGKDSSNDFLQIVP